MQMGFAKVDKRIDVPFGVWNLSGPVNGALFVGPDLSRDGRGIGEAFGKLVGPPAWLRLLSAEHRW